MGGGVAHQLKADGWPAGLRGRRVHGPDADVIDVALRGGIDLRRAVGREADQAILANERARLGNGHVVLTHVDAVGSDASDQVGSIVEDEQRSASQADPREPLRDGREVVVGRVLDPQLDDVHAATDRCLHERVRLLSADQVQLRC